MTAPTYAAILCFFAGAARGQPPAFLTPDEVDSTLNGVFSPEPTETELGSFHIVLRYLPSFAPEEQIVLQYNDATSSGTIVYETLRVPLRRALGQAGGRSGLAARAGASSKRATVDGSRIKAWLQGLSDSIAGSLPPIQKAIIPDEKTHATNLHIDGTNYVADIGDGIEHRVSINVVGPELGSGDADLRLIGFMLQVRREVRALFGEKSN